MFYTKRIIQKRKVAGGNLMAKDFRVSSFVASSPIDPFLLQEHENPYCGRSLRVTSDIYMLFNQQRLDKLTREALMQHFAEMTPSNNALASLRSKITDEQLISIVKSRYIQTPGELLSWSQYLNSLADEQLQQFVAAAEQQQGQTSMEENSSSSVQAGDAASASV